MSQQNATNGNAAVKNNDDVRVTSARSFYRTLPKSQKISLVAPEQDDLHAKEHDCCSRATD